MKDTAVLLKEWVIKPKGMMIWRDVPEYEGRYQISNHGDLRAVKEQMLSPKSYGITLINHDKVRRQLSRIKAVQYYFAPHERYKGEETFIDMDTEFYGRYQISNYGNFKQVSKIVLKPNKKEGTIVLTKYRNGKAYRETLSVVKIFLNTFPPYEVRTDEENKVITYKKKDDIVTASIKRSA